MARRKIEGSDYLNSRDPLTHHDNRSNDRCTMHQNDPTIGRNQETAEKSWTVEGAENTISLFTIDAILYKLKIL